jgi:hypothetical protein
MRKLAQEDKVKANKTANECGKQIISDLRTLAQCELKLLHCTDDFFSDLDSGPFKGKTRSIDGDIPILFLVRRKSS